MKKFFYIIVANILFFCYGCSSVKVAPCCHLYSTSSKERCPTYLILKFPYITISTRNNEYEYYSSCGSNIIGTWRIHKDTLFLKPYMEYYCHNGQLNLSEEFTQLRDSNINIDSMPRTFLIKNKGRKLIDITDYSILLGEFSKDPDIRYIELNLISEK